MARKRRSPTDPLEWLNRARSNLAQAQNVLPDVYLEDLCFNAQQAVEKALKAVCLKHGIVFPFIHDLARLLTLLQLGGVRVPKYVQRSAGLTRFAVETRYPNLSGPVTKREHGRVVRIAAAVILWAERQVE